MMRMPSSQFWPLLSVVAFLSCDSSGTTAPPESPGPIGPTPFPSGAPLSDGVAIVSTTLEFDDPPLTGIVRITPAIEGQSLQYAADLDEDGGIDETGPVGLGVALEYRFDQPGMHDIAVAVQSEDAWHTLERTMVVSDPSATFASPPQPFFGLSGGFTGVTGSEDRNAVFASTDGFEEVNILSLDSRLLQVRWQKSIKSFTSDEGFVGTTGLAVSADATLLYADVGDSIVALDIVSGAPLPGVIGPGDRGQFLVSAADGTLYSGGDNGILRLDPATGAILAVRNESFAGFGLSPDKQHIAAIVNRFRCTVALLDAATLVESWRVEVPDGGGCAAASFAPSGEFVYVISRLGNWRFTALDANSGEPIQSLTMAKNNRQSASVGISSPVAVATNGSYVVFSTVIGAFFIDTSTNLPALWFHPVDLGSDIGCCNVAAAGGAFFFVNGNMVTRVSVLR